MTAVLKKSIRSVLVHTPSLYDAVTSQRRYRLAYRLGLVHEREFRRLPEMLSREPLILDVGANWGQTVLSVKRVLPSAQVISFEPNPQCLPALRELVDRFQGVKVEPVGCSDKDAIAKLYVPSYNGKVMSGLASFDRREAENWLSSETVFGFDPHSLRIDEVLLPLRRLDSYDLSPDMIKIDVQGLEEEVVRGGMETLRRHKPILLIETPSTSLIRFLMDLGYRLQGGGAVNRFFVAT